MAVRRVYTEKREGFDLEAASLLRELRDYLGLEERLTGLRLLNAYDLDGLDEDTLDRAIGQVLSEAPVDEVFRDTFPRDPQDWVLAIGYLPGQFDQRADSAAQCIRILNPSTQPEVRWTRCLVFSGPLTDQDRLRLEHHLINPVDSERRDLVIPQSLGQETPQPDPVPILKGFRSERPEELRVRHREMGLAMSLEDLAFCQNHFRQEDRDPSETEIRMLDTYWSDHCRHTTFLTHLDQVDLSRAGATLRQAWEAFQRDMKTLRPERPVTLMELATMSARRLKASGGATDIEVSAEVNACSIIRPVRIGDREEEWLVMFKNETHNHPTEIEPFGGAATCLGGAIRDPLSGRSFVYQAMRITGSGDPRTPLGETLEGKLPQRKICQEAALGYSSYGNQIGLATGLVREHVHPGYVAKRMEVGAVIGAVPRRLVRREEPAPGDVIVLVGGRTGRDGIGGATGSSVSHDHSSLSRAGAEVQKGNPPEERKLQRLFRNPEVIPLIKRCNDFGAGGVAVAVGELAPGLDIRLDVIPLKYEGLNGTELALSESQERMALVLAPEDLPRLLEEARRENLLAVPVATVTLEPRVRMTWKDQEVVNLSRSFLDSNGVSQHAQARPASGNGSAGFFAPGKTPGTGDWNQVVREHLQDIRFANPRGLAERFDSTIGAGTTLMPFGGETQRTPVDAMVALIPAQEDGVETASVMTWGFDPDLAQKDPFLGGFYAVLLAAARAAAVGADVGTLRYSLQEYFGKPGRDADRWGLPLAALLGADWALRALDVPAIGGKDSMSGTFGTLDVPPSLLAFAVTTLDRSGVISPEWKKADSLVALLEPERNAEGLPDMATFARHLQHIRELKQGGRLLSCQAVDGAGALHHLLRLGLGNRLGCILDDSIAPATLLNPNPGAFILELTEGPLPESCRLLGRTCSRELLSHPAFEIAHDEAAALWTRPYRNVYPLGHDPRREELPIPELPRNVRTRPLHARMTVARPRVLIPVFPGNNCEWDVARAFARAGGDPELLVFTNQTPQNLTESLHHLARAIGEAQIVAIPGGFSAGDEPDGSAKFITAVFRHPEVREATLGLLHQRDGLMLGICNGFQALIKLGLITHGTIVDQEEDMPTLGHNQSGHYISTLVDTRNCPSHSPWLSHCAPGAIHRLPVAHGEGRLVASPEWLERLFTNGQVAFQYVDNQGHPTLQPPFNPNGSLGAVEGLISPDGRVLGKMAHSERVLSRLYRNVPGMIPQPIFPAGIAYFT